MAQSVSPSVWQPSSTNGKAAPRCASQDLPCPGRPIPMQPHWRSRRRSPGFAGTHLVWFDPADGRGGGRRRRTGAVPCPEGCRSKLHQSTPPPPPPRARRVSPVSDDATSALACGCIPRTSGSSRCHSLCPARNRPASTSSTAAGGAFCLSLRPGLCTMVYSCTRRNRFRLARVPSGPRRTRRTYHSFGVPQAATTTTDGRTDAHAPSIGGALAKTSHVLC